MTNANPRPRLRPRHKDLLYVVLFWLVLTATSYGLLAVARH